MADASNDLHLDALAKSNSSVRLSGFIIGAILPIALYFSSKSVTLFVGFAAIIALYGVLAMPTRAMVPPSRLVLASLLALYCFCILSIGWSAFPDIALRTNLVIAAAVFVCLMLFAAYRKVLPYRLGYGLALALIVASCVAVIQFLSDAKIRPSLGMRSENFVYNRAMIYQSILMWPMLLLIERRDRVLAGLAVVCLAVAVLFSDSGAAAFGMFVGVIATCAAALLPRLTVYAIALGTLVFGLTAPWLGKHLLVLQASGISGLFQGAHLTERIDIWRAFGELVWQQPWFGIGIGGSEKALQHPAAIHVDAALRPLLSYNHPHNAFLQAWVELGAVGAALYTVMCSAAVMTILTLKGTKRNLAVGLAAAVLSIAAVSHGAWQAWWISTIGTAVAIFLAACARPILTPIKDIASSGGCEQPAKGS